MGDIRNANNILVGKP